jgi:hypothetical protein
MSGNRPNAVPRLANPATTAATIERYVLWRACCVLPRAYVYRCVSLEQGGIRRKNWIRLTQVVQSQERAIPLLVVSRQGVRVAAVRAERGADAVRHTHAFVALLCESSPAA